MGQNHTRKVTIPADGSETFSGRIVSGEWNGGAYVDLFFGGQSAPTEVINVYDYASGTYDQRVKTPKGLRSVIREWVTDQNESDWTSWYEDYVRNGSY